MDADASLHPLQPELSQQTADWTGVPGWDWTGELYLVTCADTVHRIHQTTQASAALPPTVDCQDQAEDILRWGRGQPETGTLEPLEASWSSQSDKITKNKVSKVKSFLSQMAHGQLWSLFPHGSSTMALKSKSRPFVDFDFDAMLATKSRLWHKVEFNRMIPFSFDARLP